MPPLTTVSPTGRRLTRPVRARLRHEPGEQVLLWQKRLATSVQGFPITVAVVGMQYVAVTTGLGGGSPRLVPSTLAPEIRVPSTGQAMYVFALPDRR